MVPGLIFRGEWKTNTTYYYDAVRRDVVLNGSTYYYKKNQGSTYVATF